VASVLINLYVLAGALRGDRKVPRYLPSAALARKRLLDHMALVDSLTAQNTPTTPPPSTTISPKSPHSHLNPTNSSTPNLKEEKEEEGPKWSQIYSYSYSQSLTGCVKQLEQLIKYTKAIVGEQGFVLFLRSSLLFSNLV